MDLAVMLIEKYGANPTSVHKVRIRCNDVWMRMKLCNNNTICHVFFFSPLYVWDAMSSLSNIVI